jgi:hypothetical protein
MHTCTHSHTHIHVDNTCVLGLWRGFRTIGCTLDIWKPTRLRCFLSCMPKCLCVNSSTFLWNNVRFQTSLDWDEAAMEFANHASEYDSTPAIAELQAGGSFLKVWGNRPSRDALILVPTWDRSCLQLQFSRVGAPNSASDSSWLNLRTSCSCFGAIVNSVVPAVYCESHATGLPCKIPPLHLQMLQAEPSAAQDCDFESPRGSAR